MNIAVLNYTIPASATVLAIQHPAISTRSQLVALLIRGNGTG